MRLMKLPYGEKAYIPKEKLTGYLLSETHPVGRSKARFFRELGFNQSNIGELTKALLKIAMASDVKEKREFEYGINYVIDETIETPSGKSIMVTTIWFAKTAKSKPRFVTAYPL